MICPTDGEKLKCVDSRERGEWVDRRYKCLKCGARFASAEFFREFGTGGRQLNITGEAFGAQQILNAKQRVVEKLQAAIAEIMAD